MHYLYFYLINFLNEIFIDNHELKRKIKENGNDISPWPEQAIHLYDNLKQVDDVCFELIQKNYQSSIASLEKNKLFKTLLGGLNVGKNFKISL